MPRQVGIRPTEDDYERLVATAGRENRTVPGLVLHYLRQGLDRDNPRLTDTARQNVEAGGIDGPGTYTCRTCGGPKESVRVNSRDCRDCYYRERDERAAHKENAARRPAKKGEQTLSDAVIDL